MGWVRLHPYNISQKVQVVVEHFRELVAPLHDRMPLIVPAESYDRWLSREPRTPELLKLVETDASTLTSYQVNPIVTVPVKATVKSAAASK